ncbi:hypothetical protein [Microbacterium sp. CFBP9034]|uniref:hypothetical protein n=1 Tax=Microbacterium sp. CFBP9034 TaxID=3096540 RepID=UPI002A6A35D7|nr:hypothetical protein [Microbacterium sp. CFBP9034]MDY0911012.1 hypothetical protein [Microbacterium sp. CFBP9034]
MMHSRMSADDEREYADRIIEARQQHRRESRPRRHAFWNDIRAFLLSIPAGIGIRIGG